MLSIASMMAGSECSQTSFMYCSLSFHTLAKGLGLLLELGDLAADPHEGVPLADVAVGDVPVRPANRFHELDGKGVGAQALGLVEQLGVPVLEISADIWPHKVAQGQREFHLTVPLRNLKVVGRGGVAAVVQLELHVEGHAQLAHVGLEVVGAEEHHEKERAVQDGHLVTHGLPVHIVHAPSLLVPDNLVSLTQLHELLCRLGVPGLVGVVLLSQLVVLALDLRLSGRGGDAEDVVKLCVGDLHTFHPLTAGTLRRPRPVTHRFGLPVHSAHDLLGLLLQGVPVVPPLAVPLVPLLPVGALVNGIRRADDTPANLVAGDANARHGQRHGAKDAGTHTLHESGHAVLVAADYRAHHQAGGSQCHALCDAFDARDEPRTGVTRLARGKETRNIRVGDDPFGFVIASRFHNNGPSQLLRAIVLALLCVAHVGILFSLLQMQLGCSYCRSSRHPFIKKGAAGNGGLKASLLLWKTLCIRILGKREVCRCTGRRPIPGFECHWRVVAMSYGCG
ncbi:lipoprotein-releasing ABC transporter permease subunit [Babesia caballi]|uniref:Lipoprotein-releasing ABC transporter permease subunit n=1 Tax=Babesia caballi TaxID=5871 RepID=A0AAV4LPF1_BABCB|nr:lipoprotein-releasing ABC transporter permease subunit [Babesia caballi]